jgi:hypothetical protein
MLYYLYLIAPIAVPTVVPTIAAPTEVPTAVPTVAEVVAVPTAEEVAPVPTTTTTQYAAGGISITTSSSVTINVGSAHVDEPAECDRRMLRG